ncbi:unnamed protein product [Musa acuminata subsp. malaccensis]|nr:unnamed protein product [Musa acuminata subsp. malaccensis]
MDSLPQYFSCNLCNGLITVVGYEVFGARGTCKL